jgi:hypothetical protein
MLATVRDYLGADNLPDSILFSLTLREEQAKESLEWMCSRLSEFSEEEFSTIEKYIEYMEQNHSDIYFGPACQKALKSISDFRNERRKRTPPRE